MLNDLLTIDSLTRKDVEEIFKLTRKLKSDLKKGKSKPVLAGKTLAMIFHKPSIRTRVSFDVAMYQLGGHVIKMTNEDIQIGKRESIEDIAKTLSRFVNGIMIRTFEHQDVVDLAKYASIPVINGLTDYSHPCQALTDMYTIKEKLGDLSKVKLAYIGDANNVARSLINLAKLLKMELHIASPRGYQPDQEMLKNAPTVKIFKEAKEAVKNVDVVYTDTWVSMGQEEEAEKRKKIFEPFRLDAQLLSYAKPKALVMHCLPAHRGQEITDEVINSPSSIVFDQAENRLHVQKAVLVLLLKKQA
ncbi:MAG: ornithine carbamoyltransferase [Candidatus Margulisiibacteriota bacterium]|jgi:ornithine carbamoyltransferase